jgi:hypothetical protein
VLQLLDAGEIHRPQQQLRRMRATEAMPHLLVDEPVVLRRAFPAHAADQAKGLHALLHARSLIAAQMAVALPTGAGICNHHIHCAVCVQVRHGYAGAVF